MLHSAWVYLSMKCNFNNIYKIINHKYFYSKKNSRVRIFINLIFTIFILNLWTTTAKAEGSRELVKNGGDRPYTEWSDRTTAGIERKTQLKVFVKAGETINLGSSVHNAPSNRDIILRTPSGTEITFNVLTSGEGYIDTVTKESAGPLPNAGGYNPHQFTATETGIYEVEFRSRNNNGGDPPPRDVSQSFLSDQRMTVAAWDITVRDNNGNTKDGRVFTNYVALNMGANELELNSELFIQTKDGFLYSTKMNGLDPYGFIFFANSRGFLDDDDNPPSTLYHSAKAGNNELTEFEGNVRVQSPIEEDRDGNVTHLIFFNPPDPETLNRLSILPPVIPPAPTNFKFSGKASGNITFEGAGGEFSFNTASAGSYQIIIDTNTDGKFDSEDRIIQNVTAGGNEVIEWDGRGPDKLDNEGNIVAGDFLRRRPNNTPYEARITLRTGEYHFPMLDVENNPNGLIIEMLNPPGAFPDGSNKFTVFYNDEDYDEVDLGGPGASDPRNATAGVDSSTGAHKFTNRYGDEKGIDTWSYFPSRAVLADIIIIGKVSGTLYEDSNDDGIFDENEPRLPAGITVNLLDEDGNIVATTETEADGSYSFENVADGNYTIQVDTTDIPDGYTLTTANDVKITVAGDGVLKDFGFDAPVAGNPKVLLVKRITAINGVEINEFVDDSSTTEDNNSNWPDSDPSNANRNDFLRGAINGGLVVPGDELEYTIYFLSIGETDASKLKICDLIPNNTTFIPTAFNGSTPRDGGLVTGNLGIAISLDNTNFSSNPTAFLTNIADGDRGKFFAAGETPSTDCSRSNSGINNNGAVVVDILNTNSDNPDTIPTTNDNDKSYYGFIRFKVKIN